MKYTRKALLGVVAVDSGHLMIADPQYLFGGRVFRGRGQEEKAAFWGRDARQMCEILRAEYGVEPEPVPGGTWRVALPGRTAEEAAEEIRRIGRERGLLGMAAPWTGSARDRAYEASSGRDQGGQMCFPDGRPGAGVCFQSGLGDGVYEVWAHYAELPGWGERIAKVEVRLL
ncbi:MAG: hypothetical protein H5U04_07410 [Firmicutes bacterium]|nr:hypothetical protein [Bacillota bacterium]